MKKIYLSTIIFCTGTFMFGQLPAADWGLQLGMEATSLAPGYAEGRQVVTDASGNIYTVGYFSGATQDLDPGINTVILTSVQYGGNASDDIFITKHNSAGGLIWAKQIGDMYTDKAWGVATDGFNIFVTGQYSGTVDFDPGTDTTYLTGANNAFVLALNSSGDFLWAKSLGGSNIDEGRSIDVDQFSSVVVTGIFSGTADFDPGVGNADLICTAGYDVFIVKLNSAGNYVWAKQLEGDADEFPSKITLDNNNNILVTGYHSSNMIDLNPGPAVNGFGNNGGVDMFWVKLSNNGDFKWGRTAGSIANDYGRDIATDGLGGIVCIGTFAGNDPVDFGGGNFLTSAGYNDAFVMRMDTSGSVQWVKSISGPSTEDGMSLVLDLAANVYVTGNFMGTTDFDMDTGTVNLDAEPGGDDMFIAKYNGLGNYLWAKKYGEFNDQWGTSITFDTNYDMLITGGFYGEMALDSATTLFCQMPPTALHDMFLTKISQPVDNTGIEDHEGNWFNIYPNPATDYMVLETKGVSHIQIINSIGSLVMVKNITDTTTYIEINTLTPGLYFIQTDTGKAFRFIKI